MGGCLKVIGGIVVAIIVIVVLIAIGNSGKSPSVGGTTPSAARPAAAATSAPATSGPSFVISVTGTSGTAFSGSLMAVGGGKSVSQSVEGIVPQDYPVNGSMVSVTFQKKDEAGILRVQILSGSTVKADSQTSAAYGVVSAASQ
jgi:hypothetical protein